jgi:hypothetical protein
MKDSLVKILVVVVIAIVGFMVLRYFGLVNNQNNSLNENMTNMEENTNNSQENIEQMNNEQMNSQMNDQMNGNATQDVESVRSQNCFPKDQLTPAELLPQDNSSAWAQVNPSGSGSLKDRNFLQSGHHIGINTVGQTKRNPNLQLRSEPPNPQVKVSPWLQSTIDPDTNRKPFEVGGCA